MTVIASTSTAEVVTKKKTRRGHGKGKKTQTPGAAPRASSSGDEQDQQMDEVMDRPKDEAGSETPLDVEIVQIAPENDDDALMIDSDPSSLSTSADPLTTNTTSNALTFEPLSEAAQRAALVKKSETRRVTVPPHRMTPLKKEWVNVFGPLTEILGLQVRMNVQRRAVEMRTSRHTKEIGALQKGADFVKAFTLGFDVNDCIALLRMDDLYLDSFEIKDVKTLHGDHLARAIGRIAGHDGKTKFTIENASRTRIVLADTKIHILGSFQNIKVARDAIVSLILGSPPGKVYAGLRTVASRMRQRAI